MDIQEDKKQRVASYVIELLYMMKAYEGSGDTEFFFSVGPPNPEIQICAFKKFKQVGYNVYWHNASTICISLRGVPLGSEYRMRAHLREIALQ